MAEFFSLQMDYIFFFYGLGFLIMAGMAYILWRSRRFVLQWQWLALFGLMHGIHEWLDLLAVYIDFGSFFESVRLVWLVASFACLAEFGRATLCAMGRRMAGRWIYILVAVFLVAGYAAGGALMMNALARYVLGVGGGLLAFVMFIVVMPRFTGSMRYWLWIEAGLLLMYALTQMVVPVNAFPLAMWDTKTFMEAFGVPVQLWRGILACLLAIGLWMFWFVDYVAETYCKTKLFLRTTALIATCILLTLVGGWMLTEHLQRHFDAQYHAGLGHYVNGVAMRASAMDMGVLTAVPVDKDHETYRHLRADLERRLRANSHVTRVDIWGERDGAPVPLFNYVRQGVSSQAACVPAARLVDIVRQEGRQGACFGYAPVYDYKDGRLIAAVGLCIDSLAYDRERLRYRLVGILVAAVICCVLIGFLVIILLTREYAIELEASESRARRMLEDLEAAMAQLKKAQDHLVQSERLASIGQLAAGIAHEINNPTAFISLNLEQLEGYIAAYHKVLACIEQLKEDPGAVMRARTLLDELNIGAACADVAAILTQSKDGVNRIKKIVKDVQTFARHDGDVGPADIESALDSAVNILMAQVKHRITVTKAYGHIPLVVCNIHRIGQVFLNILINAADAMPQGGVIMVRTYVQDRQVCIEIKDTGAGIAPENLRRIFDPFFTTKPVGQGTGLGLSISYDIVKKHHGDIMVDSKVGSGSRFTIILPLEPVRTV